MRWELSYYTIVVVVALPSFLLFQLSILLNGFIEWQVAVSNSGGESNLFIIH
jgi:hypothetical protein